MTFRKSARWPIVSVRLTSCILRHVIISQEQICKQISRVNCFRLFLFQEMSIFASDMTQENKDILLKLLKQHKALGISDQIDVEKFYLDSLISNSVALADSEYGTVIDEKMVDKWSIKPSLAEKLVDIWTLFNQNLLLFKIFSLFLHRFNDILK